MTAIEIPCDQATGLGSAIELLPAFIQYTIVFFSFISRSDLRIATLPIAYPPRKSGMSIERGLIREQESLSPSLFTRLIPHLKLRHAAINLGFVQGVHKRTLLVCSNRNRQIPVVRVPFVILRDERMRHLTAQQPVRTPRIARPA